MSDLDAWLTTSPTEIDGDLRGWKATDGRSADFADIELMDPIANALSVRDIDSLYRHQVEGIQASRKGHNVIVATPTASGKSMVYTVRTIEKALNQRDRALYIAPQVALINDQTETLESYITDVNQHTDDRTISIGSYTGQTTETEKKWIKNEQPDIITTTPDMLHLSFLPYADGKWEWLFQTLDTVIIDEIHEYRGVFGSHVAMIMRRLNRLVENLGSPPQFITTSATIGNPKSHVGRVTGHPPSSFKLIEEDGSKTGPKEWGFWQPPNIYKDDGSKENGDKLSSHGVSKKIAKDLAIGGYQTVVFTRARQVAEQYSMQMAEELFDEGYMGVGESIAAYHGALNKDKRNEIEEGLKTKDLSVVWSTNALELGVDIGSLDAIIMDGYPGTTMAAHQQAGRAGRSDNSSLVVLVGGNDQLDQYMMDNPEQVVSGNAESAAVDPYNSQIYPQHLIAAADEVPLTEQDSSWFEYQLTETIEELEEKGALSKNYDQTEQVWKSEYPYPQNSISIRAIDNHQISLVDEEEVSDSEDKIESTPPAGDDDDENRNELQDHRKIGTLQYRSAMRDAHPGAIYYHQGTQYKVTELDLDKDRAVLAEADVDYYTQPLFDKDVEIEEMRDTRPLPGNDGVSIGLANVKVTERLLGYRINYHDGGERKEYELKLPPNTLYTDAVVLTFDRDLLGPVERIASDIPDVDSPLRSSLHAVEHGMIGLLPLDLLIDRSDVGGLSSAAHSQTGKPTIYIYDAYPGGVGIAESAFDNVSRILEETKNRISSCECDDGCPRCVMSPQCGNANDYLHKGLARRLLEEVLE